MYYLIFLLKDQYLIIEWNECPRRFDSSDILDCQISKTFVVKAFSTFIVLDK